VELIESKAQIATAKDEIAGLIKRIKQAENPERVPSRMLKKALAVEALR
jgi:hypothetical protein